MQSTGLNLPSLSKLFPEGLPPPPRPPPARALVSSLHTNWNEEPETIHFWTDKPSTRQAAPPIPIHTATISDYPTWSTGAPSPHTVAESTFGTTISSGHPSSVSDYSPSPSPGLSTTSSLPTKRKRSTTKPFAATTSHRPPTTKTEKEQRARRTAQRTYQDMEAILDIIVKWTHGRKQSRGNRIQSGLRHTKHDIDHAVIALLAHYLSRDLEKAAFDGTEDEMREKWNRVVCVGDSEQERMITQDPLRGSLVAFEDLEHLPDEMCACPESERECRVHTMGVNKERRLQAIRDAAARRRLGDLPVRAGGGIKKKARL